MNIFTNKNNFFYYGASIIGSIALIGSFFTIYDNLKNNVGFWFALETPIVVDILIIYFTFAVIYLLHLGKKRQALFFKIISYLLMLSSLYFNVIKSIEHSINYLALISHSVIVFGWILCAEIIVIYAKDSYMKNLEKQAIENNILSNELKRKEEIKELEHANQLDLINIAQQKRKNNLMEDTIIKEHKKQQIEAIRNESIGHCENINVKEKNIRKYAIKRSVNSTNNEVEQLNRLINKKL